MRRWTCVSPRDNVVVEDATAGNFESQQGHAAERCNARWHGYLGLGTLETMKIARFFKIMFAVTPFHQILRPDYSEKLVELC